MPRSGKHSGLPKASSCGPKGIEAAAQAVKNDCASMTKAAASATNVVLLCATGGMFHPRSNHNSTVRSREYQGAAAKRPSYLRMDFAAACRWVSRYLPSSSGHGLRTCKASRRCWVFCLRRRPGRPTASVAGLPAHQHELMAIRYRHQILLAVEAIPIGHDQRPSIRSRGGFSCHHSNVRV